jgi:hypothetical protein
MAAGIPVTVWSFPEHGMTLPPGPSNADVTISQIDTKNRLLATQAAQASSALGRSQPKSDYDRHLLMRNMAIANAAQAVFAIVENLARNGEGYSNALGIERGTAYAIVRFIMRMRKNVVARLPVYVFSQDTRKWYQVETNGWRYRWLVIASFPTLEGVDSVAVVGTRALTGNGQIAIDQVIGLLSNASILRASASAAAASAAPVSPA